MGVRMAEEKQKLQYVTMTYVGKTFTKDFGEGNKGYKYHFKENMDQQYPKNFWGSNTTKGADILDEGKEFTIGFVHKANPKGDSPLSMARFFGEPQQQSTTPTTDTPTMEPTQTTPEVAPGNDMTTDELEFFTEYKKNMLEAGHSITDLNFNHFIGTYLMNVEKDITYGYAQRMEKFWEDTVVPKTQ